MAAVLVKKMLGFFETIGEYISLIVDVAAASFKRPPAWSLIREQLYHIGVLSVSVVAITGFTTGFVLAAQSFYQLGEKGLSAITGVLVAKAMLTELGPILTAFMVTGRVGSSMCAEIGSMQVTEQIDALKSMAVNPNRYLIAPRVIAGTMMIPLLTLFSTMMGILGGYVLSVHLFHMSPANFFNPMPLHISVFDLATGIIKGTLFGFILITICCYRGLKTSGGAAGVGKATTQSVVISYVLILLFDLFLTMALNMLYKKIRFDW